MNWCNSFHFLLEFMEFVFIIDASRDQNIKMFLIRVPFGSLLLLGCCCSLAYFVLSFAVL